MNYLIMTKINVDQIVEVKILDKTEAEFYEYRTARKSWFFGNRKAGFYYTLTFSGPVFTPVEEIEKSGEMVCYNKVVYYRPRIRFKMSNGDVKYLYFDTRYEAIKYFETAPEFAGIKWSSI
jgi:hypothetical protein